LVTTLQRLYVYAGEPERPRRSGRCADGLSRQWFADFAAYKPKPTNVVPGITFMAASPPLRSDSVPHDDTGPGIKGILMKIATLTDVDLIKRILLESFKFSGRLTKNLVSG